MEMNKAKNVAENGPYSNQGGLLKIEREQLQAGQQGPGSGQSHQGSGVAAGQADRNTTVEQYPTGIDGKAAVKSFNTEGKRE